MRISWRPWRSRARRREMSSRFWPERRRAATAGTHHLVDGLLVVRPVVAPHLEASGADVDHDRAVLFPDVLAVLGAAAHPFRHPLFVPAEIGGGPFDVLGRIGCRVWRPAAPFGRCRPEARYRGPGDDETDREQGAGDEGCDRLPDPGRAARVAAMRGALAGPRTGAAHRPPALNSLCRDHSTSQVRGSATRKCAEREVTAGGF